jgi:hypothetical protein
MYSWTASIALKQDSWVQALAGQSLIIERAQRPWGVLLTFHGCGHSALDWWHPQPSCSACTGGRGSWRCSAASGATVDSSLGRAWHADGCSGDVDPQKDSAGVANCGISTLGLAGLPEETAIVERAVLRQYTVVAFSAADQAGSRCWDVGPPPQQTLDVRRTIASIAMLKQVP